MQPVEYGSVGVQAICKISATSCGPVASKKGQMTRLDWTLKHYAHTSRNVRSHRNDLKTKNSPTGPTKWTPEESNSDRDLAEASNVCMDSHCTRNKMETAADEVENVRKGWDMSEMQNSPNTPKNGTPKSTYQWRKVSINNIGAYIPQSMPVEALGWTFEFREAQSGVEVVVPSIDGRDIKERAGNQNGDDGDGDNTESNSNVDSQRVKGPWLSTKSQHLCPHWRSQENSPMLSWPPIQPVNDPYGPTRHKCHHGKLKIEHLNDKKSAKLDMIETAHLEHTSAVQPHRSTLNQVHGVYGPSCPCRRLEIKAIKVNLALNGEATHLKCVYSTQPWRNPSRHYWKAHRPRRWHGMLKIEHLNNKNISQHVLHSWCMCLSLGT